MLFRPRESQIQDLSSDIIKVYVYELFRCRSKLLSKVLVLVVQGTIEAQLFDEPFAFGVAPSDANDGRSLELCNLPNNTSSGTRGSGYNDEISGFDFADIDYAEISLRDGQRS